MALTLLSSAASASAAEVEFRISSGKGYTDRFINFRAAPGETNDVRVEPLGQDKLRITDAGAPLTSKGCEQLSEHEAACPAASFGAYLEDGDDRLSSSAQVSAQAGPGDDTLSGSAFGDSLDGGTGSDVIEGRAGYDEITGDGSPQGQPTTPAHDVLSGGEGGDKLSYYGHAVPVRVDISRPGVPAGTESEADEISGFEDIIGGAARNELVGDEGPNFLVGRGRLVGGGGDDVLNLLPGEAGSGVDGGAGHDRIFADRVAGARIGCGEGFDHVDGSELGTLTPDCDTIEPVDFVDIDDPLMRVYPRLHGDSATFRIGCADDINSTGPCRGRILMRDGAGRLVGKRRYTAPEGTRGTVGVTLDRAARKRMARPGGLEVRIGLAIAHGREERESGSWSIVLSGP